VSDMQKTACLDRVYSVTPQDLPLCCPTKEMSLWNAHPRVYLKTEKNEAVCPYCGSRFIVRSAE
jgi:uncharacterized Zn-finger protein